MRLTTTLLLVLGCATTRTEPRPTTPEACLDCTHPEGETDELDRVLARQPKATDAIEAQRLAAELETSLANPPPAVPEPTLPESLWAGYMVVQTNSVPPAVAVLFADDGIITDATLDEGLPLRAARTNSNDGYWLFPVTRGALLFTAVRVYDDGHVVVEMPLHRENEGTTILVDAGILDDPSGASVYTPSVHGVTGRLRKAVANRIVGCEGPGCASLRQPTP